MTTTKTDELDALAESWERRIAYLETKIERTGCHEDQALGIQACVDDLRAYLESASPSASDARLTAVSSTAWLDALRLCVASAKSLKCMAEGEDDGLAADVATLQDHLEELCRQMESASN